MRLILNECEELPLESPTPLLRGQFVLRINTLWNEDVEIGMVRLDVFCLVRDRLPVFLRSFFGDAVDRVVADFEMWSAVSVG